MCVAGCKAQGPPPDPLFANHKPNESKAEQAPPAIIAFAEPQVPANPATALAKSTPSARGNAPGVLTGRPVPPKESTEPPR
jgi:hypothetical protein